MTIGEIADRVTQLGTAWEQFKVVNEKRLREVETKGSADPLYTEQLGRISDALDNYKSRLDHVETVMSRPGLEIETKSGVATHRDGGEYKQAFCSYLRKGMDAGLEVFEKKTLSVGSDPDGGYLVTPTISGKIIKTVFETSPMRQVASLETISSDSIELIEDRYDATAGWTTETASVSSTTSPKIGKRTITVHELYAQPKATQKLLDDSAIDIENWLAGKVSDIFSQKENTAFISGDGVGKPRGILTYAAGTTWGKIEQYASGANGSFDGDDVIDLFYKLKEPYTRNASFMMNRATVKAARTLKESASGQYLWQPGLAAGTPDTLMGVPVVQASDMPIPATNSLSIAVGDFRQAYLVVDRVGIRVLRDPFTEKPFVKFYTTKRVGGDVINYEAIKLMKLGS